MQASSSPMLFDPAAYTKPVVKHPAAYSDALMPVFARMLQGARLCLDPFGGTGKIFLLEKLVPGLRCEAIELEPEWVRMHPRTINGDALHLPFADCSFDAVTTSPPYANRFADYFEDNKRHDRRTYGFDLGRRLHPHNSGGMQWNNEYRVFHIAAWTEALRVLQPGGRFILNIKNHIRDFKEQYVSEWHRDTLLGMDMILIEQASVKVPCSRYGANSNLRIDRENVYLFRKPGATISKTKSWEQFVEEVLAERPLLWQRLAEA